MNHYLKNIVLAVSILGLWGCAGSSFVRPDARAFELGKSTQQTIVGIMGAPKSQAKEIRNGKELHVVVYGHAGSSLGETKVASAIPAHTQRFYFLEGKLVGHEYNSTLKADCTDFDATRVKEIVKGKSTRSDVRELIGNPSGGYVKPMVTSGEAASDMFLYTHVKDGVLSGGFKNFRKSLLVTYSTDDVVVEADYNETGVY